MHLNSIVQELDLSSEEAERARRCFGHAEFSRVRLVERCLEWDLPLSNSELTEKSFDSRTGSVARELFRRLRELPQIRLLNAGGAWKVLRIEEAGYLSLEEISELVERNCIFPHDLVISAEHEAPQPLMNEPIVGAQWRDHGAEGSDQSTILRDLVHLCFCVTFLGLLFYGISHAFTLFEVEIPKSVNFKLPPPSKVWEAQSWNDDLELWSRSAYTCAAVTFAAGVFSSIWTVHRLRLSHSPLNKRRRRILIAAAVHNSLAFLSLSGVFLGSLSQNGFVLIIAHILWLAFFISILLLQLFVLATWIASKTLRSKVMTFDRVNPQSERKPGTHLVRPFAVTRLGLAVASCFLMTILFHIAMKPSAAQKFVTSTSGKSVSFKVSDGVAYLEGYDIFSRDRRLQVDFVINRIRTLVDSDAEITMLLCGSTSVAPALNKEQVTKQTVQAAQLLKAKIDQGPPKLDAKRVQIGNPKVVMAPGSPLSVEGVVLFEIKRNEGGSDCNE
jgi:hypothetical protein